MVNGILFGNENAEHDSLLFDCKIEHSSYDSFQHRIITGRWGTGKSAQLFLLNEQLMNVLSAIDPALEQIWYVKEDDLHFSTLFSEYQRHGDARAFRRVLEKIWLGEIMRRAILILGHLDNYYGRKSGTHWEVMRKTFKITTIGETVWRQLPRVIGILTSKEKGEQANEIRDDISLVFQDSLCDQIQKCLFDIKDYPVKPVITIEPLETPNSPLDKQVSLAQQVVTSLFNIFERRFQPSNKQYLDVYLAIPWHRYKIDEINLPGKISEYKYYLQWGREELKNFISERINWEFKRVNRQKYDKANPWYDLFESTIQRDSFEAPVKEDTFDYVLRFTHHRPRDIQKLARMAVTAASNALKRDKDEVLRGVGGVKVSGSYLRQAVHSYRKEACQLLIEEVSRGNPYFKEMVNLVKGLPARFKKEQLFDRTKAGIPSDTAITQKDCISMLWHAGIIGVEVYYAKDQQGFHSMLPDEAKKTDYNIKGESVTRGYFFEYNTEDDIYHLLGRYEDPDRFRVKIVLHPKTFDTLIGQATIKWPIGV